MYAVIFRDDAGTPEVYVLQNRETAEAFRAWVADTDPANDGSDAFYQSYATVTRVEPTPAHWDKSL